MAYVMLDLNRRGRDVRCFVRGLELWLIGALLAFDLLFNGLAMIIFAFALRRRPQSPA